MKMNEMNEKFKGRLGLGMAGFRGSSPCPSLLCLPSSHVPQGGRMAAATLFLGLLASQVQVQGIDKHLGVPV